MVLGQDMNNTVVKYLRKNFFLYGLIVAVAALLINAEAAQINRLNYIKGSVEEYLLHYQYQKVAGDTQQWQQSLMYFKQLERLSPDNAIFTANVGFCYWHLGQRGLALEHYRRAIELEPQLYALHWDLAVILYRLGRYEEAAKEMSLSLDTIPLNESYFVKVAERQAGLADQEGVRVMVFRLGSRAERDEEQGIHLLSQCAYRRQDYQRMRHITAMGLRQFPQSAQLNYDHALALYLLGQAEAAQPFLAKAAQVDSEYLDIFKQQIRSQSDSFEGERQPAQLEDYRLHLNLELARLRHQL